MSINCDAIETTNENSKNIVLKLIYRPPNGDVKEFKKHLNKILSTNIILNKEVIMAGRLLISNKKIVQNYLNTIFGHSMMPVVNKPTRVIKNTPTATDQIISR